MTGTNLGPYRVLEKLGAGGMGEVYRARDTKLDRDVAIKILPDSFAHDAERVARFTREAKRLAALNHPHIAQIHGLEEARGIRALVMELVDGPTLAEVIGTAVDATPPNASEAGKAVGVGPHGRLRKAGLLTLEETLAIAKQIAEALEAAHEHGIIHRDLKPANIKVRDDGTVKVLDFGLAKLAPEAASATAEALGDSPTVSSPAAMTHLRQGYGEAGTLPGVILGTAAYMAPEQAKGRIVDKRADIWAFGCVLFEMLTGRRAFDGDDVPDTLANVLKADPEWGALPDETPTAIRKLLRRCLVKDHRQRLGDIRDARIEIEDALAGTSDAAVPLTAPAGRSRWRLGTVLALGALACIALGGALAWNVRPPNARSAVPVSRLAVLFPGTVQLLERSSNEVLAVSPDGARIAFVAVSDGKQQIYLRDMDSLESRPVAGTEGGNSPFFSPDGKWLGFSNGVKLMKVSLDGRVPFVLCDASNLVGVNWAEKDTVVFAAGWGNFGLSKVSAAGGVPEPLTKREPAGDSGESQRWPERLPGGSAVLFTDWAKNVDETRIVVQRLDTGERRVVIRGGTNARYSPTGHFIYARAESLLAVPFDLSRLEVTGDPVRVADGVMLSPNGAPQFGLSKTGSLVYVPGESGESDSALVWVDRKGSEYGVGAPSRRYSQPRLSPDGQRIAIPISGANDDIWVYDIPRQALTRLTFEARNLNPIWTPDGEHVVFRSTQGGLRTLRLFWTLADGSGGTERLSVGEAQAPNAITPDGNSLVFMQLHPTSSWDLWILPLSGDRQPRPLLQTPFQETGATLSPDGHWLAYMSNESGRNEVYVRPFPAGAGKWQVSTEGGSRPVWSRNGELFYNVGNRYMAVTVETQPTLSIGTPRLLFEGSYLTSEAARNFDVSSDGQRLLMLKPVEQNQTSPQIVVVLNWFEELKARVDGNR